MRSKEKIMREIKGIGLIFQSGKAPTKQNVEDFKRCIEEYKKHKLNNEEKENMKKLDVMLKTIEPVLRFLK